MKRLFSCLLCAVLLSVLSGCTAPDSLKLDLYQGYHRGLHLLHWNASSAEQTEKIEFLAQSFEDAVALEKDFSQFAYYPDYRLVIHGKSLQFDYAEDGKVQGVHVVEDATGSIEAVVDLNGDKYVDFYLPESDFPQTLFRSPYQPIDWLVSVNS